jgi:mevalonate kinase
LISVGEAPGKAILTGEHFVVHGSYAIAAALNRTVQVEVSNSDSFLVESEQVRLKANSGNLPRSFSAVAAVVLEACGNTSVLPRFRLKITSQLPAGAGLGSSAATMVATAAAVARHLGSEPKTDDVIRFALVGEKAVHGKPSGIDVAASAYGGVIGFKMGRTPTPITLSHPTNIVIAYSGKRRKTRKLLSKVSAVRESHPALFSSLSKAVSALSLRTGSLLSEGLLEEVGELFLLDHGALSLIGASSPELDRLVESCLEVGCYGAKLTGAGGGGCVVAVSQREKTKSIVRHLTAKSYKAFSVSLPQGGVRTWTK